MPIQDIIRNAYESNALDAKQAIYDALSERAMEVLDIKKTEIATNLFNAQNESLDEEQLNELSKKTLGNYISKAAYDSSMAGFKQGKAVGNAGAYHKKPDTVAAKENAARSDKRQKGIDLAVKKLTKEEYEAILEGVSSEAHELLVHGDNDHHMYKSSYVPVAKNLEKKFKKGTYDHEKAKKLWKYHADRVADSYAAAHGSQGQKGHHMFSPAHRREAASAWADTHHAEMKLGNFHEK